MRFRCVSIREKRAVDEFVVRIAYISIEKEGKKKKITINGNMFVFVAKRERKKRSIHLLHCITNAKAE